MEHTAPKLWLAVFLVLTGCLATLPARVALAEPSAAIEGILVLRNGNVLSGRMIRLKDHYQIELPNGQLRVPVTQVEMYCRNLDEAYQRRRQTRTGSAADSHLELARWCLRQDLCDFAERELLDARAIDPHHRELALLERRLQQARSIRAHQHSAAPVPITTPTPSNVQAAQHVPREMRAAFVRQIQPLLVRSCASSGCHAAGSSREFELNALAMEGAGHPQATLFNLTSVLEQLDEQVVEESVLLHHARKAHGSDEGAHSQPLELRQLFLLSEWAEQLALPKQAPRPSSISTAGAELDDPFDPEAFNQITRLRAEEELPPATNLQPATALLPTDQ
ncbi:MAG: hypothetical protein KDA57_05525 [Planctomycetales bacterium]|nr:hypothetical protein [Planctomycetales bacterium]